MTDVGERGYWTIEHVSFDAAYGSERMSAYVYLPRHRPPPYQAVIMFPGGGAIFTQSFDTHSRAYTFLVESGRAFVFPIYKSTFDRRDGLASDYQEPTIRWRDHVVMWTKDFKRTVDYLSTRPDIDTTKIAYFGSSWGAVFGGLIPAVEPRIKTVILVVAGLEAQPTRPEVDPLNYLSHIKAPVLMLNGKYDYYFPIETAQKPFFRLLGTAAADKRYVVYDGAHDVPRTALIAESLAWLDKYLGPVR